MSVAIVMPFRAQSEERFRAASWVSLRLRSLHPDWPLVVAVEADEPWTKGKAVNRAVTRIDAEKLVIIDADVAVPKKALEWAVATIGADVAWAVPFGTVYRLDRDATARALARSPDVEPVEMEAGVCTRPPYDAVPGGGVLAVTREAFETVRGFDARFVFGQEDAPLGHALDTLAGPHEQLPAPLWHLHHPARDPHGRGHELGSDMRLETRYIAARGDVEAMRRLIRERGAGPPVTVKRA